MSTTTSNLQDTLHIKLQFNDEYRRFNVTRSCKYAELVEKIKAILTLNKDFTLKYKDDENEWITISSDIELDTGIGFCKLNLLRLLVSVKKTSVDSECGTSNEDCEGMDLWKKRRMMRWKKRMEEGFGDEDGGHKWRRWRRCRRGSDEDSGECKKWKKCGKWRKNEECGEEEGRCPRRRWRKNHEDDNSDGECKRKCRKGKDCDGEEKKECRKKGKWSQAEREEWLAQRREKREKRFSKRKEEEVESEKDTTSFTESDLNSGDELLSLEQIKKEIETLKATVQKLREKVNEAKEGLNAIKGEIAAKRKAGSYEEVLTLRGKLKTVKEEKFTLFTELKKNQRRIRVLSRLASKKAN